MPSSPCSSTNPGLCARSPQPPLCPARTWSMGRCPHRPVNPLDLGRPCLPRAAHPPSGQQPPKLGPQVSMGHRPWAGGEGSGGLCSGEMLALALLGCGRHSGPQTSSDDVAACLLWGSPAPQAWRTLSSRRAISPARHHRPCTWQRTGGGQTCLAAWPEPEGD